MLARIVRPAQFALVLGTPPCSRTAHFTAHYSASMPTPAPTDLSTSALQKRDQSVGNSAVPAAGGAPALGLVVPKRHAKRAVTRTLIKRQMRAAALTREAALAPGLWVLRLRAGFDAATYTSARSGALAQAVHAELAQLLDRALTRATR